jgi:hypothetical protein
MKGTGNKVSNKREFIGAMMGLGSVMLAVIGVLYSFYFLMAAAALGLAGVITLKWKRKKKSDPFADYVPPTPPLPKPLRVPRNLDFVLSLNAMTQTELIYWERHRSNSFEVEESSYRTSIGIDDITDRIIIVTPTKLGIFYVNGELDEIIEPSVRGVIRDLRDSIAHKVDSKSKFVDRFLAEANQKEDDGR